MPRPSLSTVIITRVILGALGILTVYYCLLTLQTSSITGSYLFFSLEPEQPQSLGIPKKLWYKLGPRGLSDQLQGYVDSCITQNPAFEFEFLTDASGDEFVRSRFSASHPDLVANFLTISIPIVKADLLRYLILYEYGGIWNDLDVSCEAPVAEWIPEQYRANASIVVGLEFDVDIWVRQFASWTIVAKPRSPHLLAVAEDCLKNLSHTAAKHGISMGDLRLGMLDDIVDVSGPRRLTRSILASVSTMLNQTVGNDEISHTPEPRLIGDVLVMPDYAFANTMNMKYGDKESGRVLVTHHYAGSWKNDNGGEEPLEI
ncbi:initiation-specific alpha-1,6-mannosyltransferase [Xylariaceae sp. FL0255]|nr:initiation-specific alpha-1,6-mannosyltransferase [Xylariaceae sp. FL0255]